MPQLEKPASANTRCSITRFASLGLLFPFSLLALTSDTLGYNSACTYGCGILGLFLFRVYRVVLVIGYRLARLPRFVTLRFRYHNLRPSFLVTVSACSYGGGS